MDSFANNMDDALDLSDGSDESLSSSKSALFMHNQPVVLELHDIKKDVPAAEKVTPEAKPKKRKRRGHPVAENKTGSATSSTGSIPAVTDSAGKEEFYDADGTYHDLAAKPAAALALAIQQSEHNQDPKLNPETANVAAVPQREPSNTIKKPAIPPK